MTMRLCQGRWKGTTQTFSLTTTLGIVPVIPDGLMKGTIGVTVTDNNSNGAKLETVDPTNPGSPIYQGLINGNTAHILWDSPKDVTVTDPSVSLTSTDTTSFGIPTREPVPGSIISSSIGKK